MHDVTPSPSAAPPQPSGPPSSPNSQVIEQYKAKLADLGNIGVRQTAMTTYYVSILTALFGVLAFKDRSLSAIDAAVIVAICVPGILVSILWYAGVLFFRNLFRAKLKVLENIENALPFQTFRTEFDDMKRNGRTRWLNVERFVPVVFLLVFAGILCVRFVPLLAAKCAALGS